MRSSRLAALTLILTSLTGCFAKLPDPDACASDADCLTGERCRDAACIRVITPDDMDPADLDTPDDMRVTPDAAPDLPPEVDTPADVDMPAGPTIVVLEAHSSTDVATLAPRIPLCIFSANFANLASAGGAVTRRITDAQGQVTLNLDELGLAPEGNYRIWTGAPERGEGDTTGYQPYEMGEQYTFPSKGKMKTIKISVVPCDNSQPGQECVDISACTVP